MNFGPGLLVTSLRALIRSILSGMGLDQVYIHFAASAAVGAAVALLVILFAGIGIPRRSTVKIHRSRR